MMFTTHASNLDTGEGTAQSSSNMVTTTSATRSELTNDKVNDKYLDHFTWCDWGSDLNNDIYFFCNKFIILRNKIKIVNFRLV